MFTVNHNGGSIQRREFDAYVRLLQQRRIDWSNCRRIAEPNGSNRWLYVWENRSDADSFCRDLQSETLDVTWEVHTLEDGTQPSRGSLVRLVILMRVQDATASFSLHPHSRALVHRRYSQAKTASHISVDWLNREDFEIVQSTHWDHIAQMLTGLKQPELEAIEGYQIYNLFAETVVFDSQSLVAV